MIDDLFTIRRYGNGKHDWQLIPLRMAETVDALLDPSTDFRITPEPANKIAPGEMGVRLVGSAGPAPAQVSLDDLREEAARLRANGATQEADVIDAVMLKFGGGKSRANGVGITATDDARRAVAEIAANIANNQAVAKAFDDYWKERLARDRADILGRSP